MTMYDYCMLINFFIGKSGIATTAFSVKTLTSRQLNNCTGHRSSNSIPVSVMCSFFLLEGQDTTCHTGPWVKLMLHCWLSATCFCWHQSCWSETGGYLSDCCQNWTLTHWSLCHADLWPDSYSLALLLICGNSHSSLARQLAVNLSHLLQTCLTLLLGY